MTERFDSIVVGAGQAGPPLAARLAASGRSVALIERDRLGGTCVNTGCTPTKALIASARAMQLARRGPDFGFAAGQVEAHLPAILDRARGISLAARERLTHWLASVPGLSLVTGHARFTAPGTLQVGDCTLAAPEIFLDVGTRPSLPLIPGIDRTEALDNETILALRELPAHLVVIGGSYIGLEFAQMFRRFGSEVTVVEAAPRLVRREDEDIAALIRTILEAEGVHIRTGAKCISLASHASGVSVGVDCEAGEPVVVGSHLLMAVGRVPNTANLGLREGGIEADPRGYIVVDEHLRTSARGVWALGDCNGRGGFTHTAWNDFEIVAANLLDDGDRLVAQRVSGYALFVDPPLGRAGMTLEQARASGRPLLAATRPMSRVARAVELGEPVGLMRLIADAETRAILGAAILGPGGDEAIHAVINLMAAGATVEDLRWAVPVHPTVAELLPTLATALEPL